MNEKGKEEEVRKIGQRWLGNFFVKMFVTFVRSSELRWTELVLFNFGFSFPEEPELVAVSSFWGEEPAILTYDVTLQRETLQFSKVICWCLLLVFVEGWDCWGFAELTVGDTFSPFRSRAFFLGCLNCWKCKGFWR